MARGYPVGLARALIWTYVLTGARKGTAIGQGSTIANGATSGAFVLPDVKTANLAPVPAETIEIQGGDRIVATPAFGGGKTSPFEIVSSSIDTVLMGLIAGSNVNTTNSQHTYFGPNHNRSTPRSLGCAIQQRIEMSDGSTYFLTRIFPVCGMVIGGGNAAFRAGNDSTITVSPVNTSTALDGRSFGSTGLNLGYQDDIGDTYWLISPYPVYFVTFAADGTATTFSTIYKPVSTTVTINASVNEMVKNATVTALSAITLAGTATLAAAGTAADLHVLTLGTEYVPV
jgi:hypothetical protein